jgi:hypothetical protein
MAAKAPHSRFDFKWRPKPSIDSFGFPVQRNVRCSDLAAPQHSTFPQPFS